MASRFLDHDVFRRGEAHLAPALRIPNLIPNYVRPFMADKADFQRVATRFYQVVHPWLPVISKRKVYDRLLNPLLPLRIDSVFLCLCMKLLALPLENENPWTAEYYATTRLFIDIQAAGVLSMETLQGYILVAVYELGHAMYPAAQTSLGISLKIALSLGMGWNCSTEKTSSSMAWIDTEERRRTWWAIFMLERFVLIRHYSALCTDVELRMTDF